MKTPLPTVSGVGVMCAAATAAGVAMVVVESSIIRNNTEGARESTVPETVMGAPPGVRDWSEMTKVGPEHEPSDSLSSFWYPRSCC